MQGFSFGIYSSLYSFLKSKAMIIPPCIDWASTKWVFPEKSICYSKPPVKKELLNLEKT
jgi:hypothetical protein